MARLALAISMIVGCDEDQSLADIDLDAEPERPASARVGAVIETEHAAGSQLGPMESETLEIHEPGATFLKLRFATLELAKGDEVLVHDSRGAQVQVFHESGREVWARAVPGDRIVLTLRAGSGARRGGFVVDRVGIGEVSLYGGRVSEADDVQLRTICGQGESADDMRPAACFEGKVAEGARPIGRMLYMSSADEKLYVCTGSLISTANHFLTNNHCVSSQAEVDTQEIWFGYQTKSCASQQSYQWTVIEGGTFLATSVGLDYTLVRLPGDPAAQYGWLQIDDVDVDLGTQIYIPQHPVGRPKAIAVDDSMSGSACSIQLVDVDVEGAPNKANVGYYCDTEIGSSGAPVIRASDNKLIALHNSGGCHNLATKMSEIWPSIRDYVNADVHAETGELHDETHLTKLSKSAGSALTGHVVVPAGTKRIEIETYGGSGDLDLYVRRETPPTLQAWDYRPYLEGNDERVTVYLPQPGVWHVMAYAHEGFSGVSLDVDLW